MAFKSAVHCNVSIETFWNMTPKELNLIIEMYMEKEKNKLKENLTVAFYNAYFQRIKTLSSMELKKVLSSFDKVVMSDEEMLLTVKALHHKFGGDKIGKGISST